MGEEGNQAPIAMMIAVVTISGQLARLCWKGIRLVRMTWKFRTGWPRAVTRPGLPQTRTCAINAFGSSGYTFAALRRTPWTTRRVGSG
jgi:hypothetical protein